MLWIKSELIVITIGFVDFQSIYQTLTLQYYCSSIKLLVLIGVHLSTCFKWQGRDCLQPLATSEWQFPILESVGLSLVKGLIAQTFLWQLAEPGQL